MNNGEQEQRLEKITKMLVELSRGNFSARAELGHDDDSFNVILSGLNMLAEELSYFKAQLDIKTALLENTLYNISEVIYAIRITGTDLQTIRHEFISQRVRDLLGYTTAEIYNDSSLWFNAIHPDDADIVYKTIKEMHHGAEATCEYRIRSRNTNGYVWIEDRMSPRRVNNGAETEIFCAARDVSQRRKLGEEREQLIRELSTRYNELTQFSYIVSHNLRSPVAGILGACEILHMDLDETERQMTYDLIIQAANKLDTLLKDLNAILSTRSKINELVETFSLTAMLHDLERLLSAEIAATNATLIFDVTPRADMLASIKSYIQSCLYNLLSNAIKYRRPDVAPKISVKIWKEYQTTYVEVADNGTGIDLGKHKNEIFGLYKRFNTHTEGKGLGLHMTKAQIESLGGNIVIDSAPGKGTTFLLHLPQ